MTPPRRRSSCFDDALTSPEQMANNGCDGNIEKLGCLPIAQVLHANEQQDLTLNGGKRLDLMPH